MMRKFDRKISVFFGVNFNPQNIIILFDLVKHHETLRIVFVYRTEYRVNAIQVRAWSETEEELASARIGTGMGHRERTSSVRMVAGIGLAVYLPVRPACSGHGGVACRAGVGASALRHETGDHSVELQVIIEAFIRKVREVRNRVGSIVREKLDPDITFVRLDLRILVRFHYILRDVISF